LHSTLWPGRVIFAEDQCIQLGTMKHNLIPPQADGASTRETLLKGGPPGPGFLFVAAIFLALTCAGSDMVRYAEQLCTGTDAKRVDAIHMLHRKGKAAIPHLIDRIDDSAHTVRFFLTNPFQSDLSLSAACDYAGLLPAYVVELILARDSMSLQASGTVLVNHLSFSDYLFSHGVIVRRKDAIAISGADLQLIKTRYRDWWDRHSDLSLEELQACWKSGDQPLSQSEYSWF